MKAWKVCWVLLAALLINTNTLAESALYKSIPLQGITILEADGNLHVEVIYSHEERAEVFLRKNAINSVIISKEPLSLETDEQEATFRLRVREQPALQNPKDEESALAIVKLYTSIISFIAASELQQLVVSNQTESTDKWLRIRLSGDSKAQVNGHFVRLTLDINETSDAQLMDSKTKKLVVRQRDQSRLNVADSQFNEIDMNGRHTSLFTANSITAEQLKVTMNQSARITFDQDSLVEIVDVEARNQSQIHLLAAQTRSTKVNVKNQAEVHLGNANHLHGSARHQSLVTYRDTDESQLNVKIRNNAKLKRQELSHE
ncbi:hypothetical protein C2869_03905 [Saccharobesus litoralis]|uniref:Uncharacterized protein n=1 Tax=Saccharobesus litoralis TaxID=2172099 RepID=A0A2S0VN81_9ALTE|nr:DUF2807 domain-containing protein [Saccharobesus litoralis]AWB65632.1 hypothetical protein C2869_03905 [Saccharobesus litoralis]